MSRPRITIDVEPDVRRKIRLAAARRDQTVRQYMLDAVEVQLRLDTANDDSLTADADPVLAEIWDNERDASYDDL